jgi:hypothetical protein
MQRQDTNNGGDKDYRLLRCDAISSLTDVPTFTTKSCLYLRCRRIFVVISIRTQNFTITVKTVLSITGVSGNLWAN